MGGKKQTVTNKAEPWGPAQGYLQNAFGQASDLYGSGAFAPVPYGFGQYATGSPTASPTPTAAIEPVPTAGATPGSGSFGGMPGSITDLLYGGRGDRGGSPIFPGMGQPSSGGSGSAASAYNPLGGMSPQAMEAAARSAAEMRVPGFGSTTTGAMQAILDRAGGGAPGIDAARSTMMGIMGGTGFGNMQGVRDNILGSAIPAATSMFSGSGMTNSSTAMDGVGRAATEALAPFEYGAFENQQNRAMQAAGMMPGMEQAAYLPEQMRMQVGQSHDAFAQNRATAAQQAYGEAAGMKSANFQPYLQAIMGLGGMGGNSSQTSPQQGTGLGPAIMGGLGAYGTLAGIEGIGSGMAGLGGLLAGLAGLSDRRAKEDIQRIGATDKGTPIYRYKYKGTDTWAIGVMADENQHAIKGYTETGMALVDYSKVA